MTQAIESWVYDTHLECKIGDKKLMYLRDVLLAKKARECPLKPTQRNGDFLSLSTTPPKQMTCYRHLEINFKTYGN